MDSVTARRTSACFFVFSILITLLASGASAQVARVAALQQRAEKRSGGNWQQVGVGAGLGVGDALRTGKRSKADVKFGDGSLLRLGQLSSMEIRTTRTVNMLSGQLLYAALHPARVLAGAGEAEIKGSVALITRNDDGSTEFTLYSGTMNVITPRQQVALPPGFWVEARPDGTLGPLRFATPFGFAGSAGARGAPGSTGGNDLTEPPIDGPYVGSDINVRVRTTPERLTLDQNTNQTIAHSDPEIGASNPFGNSPQQGDGSPFPVPFPTPPQPVPTSFPPVASMHRSSSAVRVADSGADPIVGGIPAPDEGVLTSQQNLSSLDLEAALNHIDMTNRDLGAITGGDVALVAALQDEGGQAWGARLHTFSSKGRWFLDLAAVPLRLRFHTPTGPTTQNASAISSAFIAYREERGEVQIGRQRFMQGPTQATLFGSLVRQGGREVMDAVRISPNLGRRQRLEIAYLYDSFVRNLPYRAPTGQRGYYARYARQQRFANIGVNVLGYNSAPVPTTTGITADFAVPLLHDKLELYGEFGRDPFRRQLRTVGLNLPWLYERTDLDVYLEYANLRASSTAGRPPTELALRVYRALGDNVNIVAALSRFYRTDTALTIGLSVGARTVTHGQ